MKTLIILLFVACFCVSACCATGKQENVSDDNKEMIGELYANEYGEIRLIKVNNTSMRTIFENNEGKVLDTTMFINYDFNLIQKHDSLPFLQLGMSGIELRNECLFVHDFSNIAYLSQLIRIEEMYTRPFYKIGKELTVDGDVTFAKGYTINGIWLSENDSQKIPERYVSIHGAIRKEKYPIDYYSTDESPQGMFGSDTSIIHYRLIMEDYTINDIPQSENLKAIITLHSAARYINHYNDLKLLIENGEDVNAVDHNGDTPLYINLLYGIFTNDTSDYKERFKKASLLIQSGAKVNVKGSALPLIFYSVENYEILKLLVEAGANVNEKNYFNHLMTRGGDTPLHWASQYGTLKEVQYLLANGAYVNAEDDCGWIPLHCAIFSGNVELVNFYLSKEMDKTIRTKKEFEVLWGGLGENPYPANSTLLQIAKISQSNAHRYDKKPSDYDDIINLLKQ